MHVDARVGKGTVVVSQTTRLEMNPQRKQKGGRPVNS